MKIWRETENISLALLHATEIFHVKFDHVRVDLSLSRENRVCH